jgi:hypothetical protein
MDRVTAQVGTGPPIEVVQAHLRIEQRQRPEADQRQPVGVDRRTDDLRNHVVGGGEAEGRHPQTEDVVGVPPVEHRLLDAPEEVRQVAVRNSIGNQTSAAIRYQALT